MRYPPSGPQPPHDDSSDVDGGPRDLAERVQEFLFSGRHARIFCLTHRSERLADLAVGNEVEEWRLPQLSGKSLSQHVVEHRAAGLIIEIREDSRILSLSVSLS
jgi:hypothetical protein